eukprot:5627638-Pyramimonas_sp.AAC.1
MQRNPHAQEEQGGTPSRSTSSQAAGISCAEELLKFPIRTDRAKPSASGHLMAPRRSATCNAEGPRVAMPQ